MGSKSPAPEGFLLHRINWDFFVTLTHAPWCPGRKFSVPPARHQERRFYNYCRKVCKELRIDRNSFLWVKRTEVGRGGRDHFHMLINFHKRDLVNKTTRHFLRSVWNKDGFDYGHAHSRFCGQHGASEYITKLQNDYEMSRFGAERYRHVELSKSAQKTLRRLS